MNPADFSTGLLIGTRLMGIMLIAILSSRQMESKDGKLVNS
jgi:hypothetical protein